MNTKIFEACVIEGLKCYGTEKGVISALFKF